MCFRLEKNKDFGNSMEFRLEDHWNVVLCYQKDFHTSHLQHTICLGNCGHKIPAHIQAIYKAISDVHERKS